MIQIDLRSLDVAFPEIVTRLQPRLVVELGTGAGVTAAKVMGVLPLTSRFVTINWANPPSGDEVGRWLEVWAKDARLRQVLGDTRDPWVVNQVPYGVDLLFIDSGTIHECSLISAEWELYRPKLVDGAIVVCDDINHNDMRKFWDPLPYDKVEIWNGTAGLFRYDSGKMWES